jgi:tetratricopeptide (TPR) repeat protein
LLNIQLALGAISTSRAKAREGKTAEALAEAERATKLWPKSPDAFLNLGLLRYDAGDKDRALAALTEAKSLNPKFRGQLEGTLKFTGHAPLDADFLKKLFPESH